MEYILGAITATLAIFVAKKLWEPLRKPKSLSVRYSQSHTFELMKPALTFLPFLEPIPDSQSKRFSEKDLVNVLIYENKAYWIRHNAVFQANIVDGNVDQQSAEKIDTMKLDKPELEKLSFVIEQLNERNSK